MSKINKQTVIEDIRSLGVKDGDLLFITADLMKVGLRFRSREEGAKLWLTLLKECVGDRGTIICASYTKTFWRFFPNNEVVFSRFSRSTAGSLSNILIDNVDSIRSKHPTNSYVGIGPLANSILESHDERGLSYDPIGSIIKLNGKNLLLGAIDNSNAPMVMHYIQQELGHTRSHPLLGLTQCFYFDSHGRKLVYTRRDAGGCSSGGKNLIGLLVANNCCTIGKTGMAYSALIDSRQSFSLVKKAMADNPSLIKCGQKHCLSCYGRFFEHPILSTSIYTGFARKIFNRVLDPN